MNKRIGIFSGAFNPVHSGHVMFAVQAMNSVNLDSVYFLPERRPRKVGVVEHYGHRVAMLKQALKPHPKLDVLEFVETSLSVERTLPKLKTLFLGDQLVILVGSDLVEYLQSWPKAERLIKTTEFAVGLRREESAEQISSIINRWPMQPKAVEIIKSYAPNVSSSRVRRALRKRTYTSGILSSVERYSNKHWLYISLAVDRA